MKMEDWQQRVVDEADELASKTNAWMLFASPIATTLWSARIATFCAGSLV